MSTPSTPEIRLYDELAKRALGLKDAEGRPRRLTRDEWLAAVREFLAREFPGGAKPARKPKGVGRARNPLFDALCTLMGHGDPTLLTRNAAKAVGVSLADILAVCPDLTPEELERRATAYKRRWPDRRNWSAPALAKHWAEFGGPPTRTGIAIVAEPKEDWRAAAQLVAEETLDFGVRESRLGALRDGYKWEQFGPEFRRLIFDKLAKNRKVSA